MQTRQRLHTTQVYCLSKAILEQTPNSTEGLVPQGIKAAKGVCVTVSGCSYLHQGKEVIHCYSYRVLQPALINDIEPLLLCLLLYHIHN